MRLIDYLDIPDLDCHDMRNCKEVVDVLSDYLANELSEEDADGVRTHIRKCRNCKAVLASLRTTIKWTHDLETEDVPDEVVDSVQKFLKSKIGKKGQ